MPDLKKLSDDLVNQAEKKTNQVVPEGYTSLGAPFEIDDYVHEMTKWMGSHADFGGFSMPRFGLMSLMVSSTPILAYDNPVMNSITTTGFTDGIRVFMHVSMLEKLRAEEEESGGVVKGFVPLAMHEFMHKLRRHPDRHAKFDPVLRNIAQDLNIQATILEAFPEMQWATCLRETGLGFGPGEKEKYIAMSEEAIYFQLLQEGHKSLKQPKPPGGGGGKGGSGGGGGGGRQPPTEGPGNAPGRGGSPKQQQQQGGQQPQGGQGAPSEGSGEEGEEGGQFGAPGDFHTITPEELIKKLEEAGMDETMRRLNLPSSTDKEAIQATKDLADMGRVEAINKAYRQMKDAEEKGFKYPGRQMVHGAVEMLSTQAKPKMSYKLAMRDLFIQSGTREVYVEDDEPDEPYYVDSITEMLGGSPLYTGVHIATKPECAVLVVFDASGSVDNENFKEGLAEVFGLKRLANQFGDSATEVLVVMGDTQLTQGVQVLNEDNYEKVIADGVERQCFGGTNLAHVLNQALKLPQLTDKHIQGVLMFTDSFDTPPPRESLDLSGSPTIVYAVFSTTGTGDVEKFAAGVASYARTVQVDEGVEVDLSESYMETMSASPSQNRRRSRGP